MKNTQTNKTVSSAPPAKTHEPAIRDVSYVICGTLKGANRTPFKVSANDITLPESGSYLKQSCYLSCIICRKGICPAVKSVRLDGFSLNNDIAESIFVGDFVRNRYRVEHCRRVASCRKYV